MEEVFFIVKKGKSINSEDKWGMTCLHLLMAVNNCFYGAIELLMTNGADATIEDHGGRTPLEVAVAYNYKEPIEILLRRSRSLINRKNSHSVTPFADAVFFEKIDNAILLLLEGADVNTQDDKGLTPLMNAVIIFNLTVVHFLMKNGANTSIKNKKNEDVFDILVSMEKKPMDVNYEVKLKTIRRILEKEDGRHIK